MATQLKIEDKLDTLNAYLDDIVTTVKAQGETTNDYDDESKAKVDAIPENPKYTDTVYDDTEIRSLLNDKISKNGSPEVGHIAVFNADGNVTDGGAVPEVVEYTAGTNVIIDEDGKISANFDDSELKGLIDSKVDKADGKGLSSNDYTSDDKTKVDALMDNSLIFAANKTAPTDVDDSEMGFYTVKSESCANLPGDAEYWLLNVKNASGNGVTFATGTGYNSKPIYMRKKNTSGVTTANEGWQKLIPTLTSELTNDSNFLTSTMELLLRRDSLTTSSNANNIKQTGFYYCPSNVSNLPSTYPGLLVVFVYNSGSNIIQFFTRSYNAAYAIYMRKYSSSAWGSWTKVTLEAV